MFSLQKNMLCSICFGIRLFIWWMNLCIKLIQNKTHIFFLGGALKCQGEYQARPKIHVKRVIFHSWTVYVHNVNRVSNSCKTGLKGYDFKEDLMYLGLFFIQNLCKRLCFFEILCTKGNLAKFCDFFTDLCVYAAVNGKLELTLLKGRQRFDTVSTSNLKVYKFRERWIFT